VELADTEALFLNPKHPYTEALMSAVPVPEPDYEGEEIILTGDVPSPTNPPSGCYFNPRCRCARDVCRNEAPIYRTIEDEHFVACHLAESLKLQPIRTISSEEAYGNQT
jgi:peptide/nickel transport system ATP-binding protein